MINVRVLTRARLLRSVGAVIAMEYRPDAGPNTSSVHLLGLDTGEVQLQNLTAWQMGCGYTSHIR